MDCDVAVLGGGPGGYTAAIRAAQLGANAVCIEKEPELGGTCLRVGCIPTKAWVQTAFALKEAEETFGKLGVQVGEPRLDLGAANEWKAGVVKQMTSGVASLFKANGVEWVKGSGRFKDANTIAVVPSRRGKGFGHELMTGLLERARRAGYDALSLSVAKDSPAVSLYERYGFRAVAEPDDALTMVAKLGSPDGL